MQKSTKTVTIFVLLQYILGVFVQKKNSIFIQKSSKNGPIYQPVINFLPKINISLGKKIPPKHLWKELWLLLAKNKRDCVRNPILASGESSSAEQKKT